MFDELHVRGSADEFETVDLVAFDFQNGLIAKRERRLVERRVEKRGDEENPLLTRHLRVEIAAGRSLLAESELLGFFLTLGAKRDLDPRRIEAVLFQVGSGRVDDAIHFE